MFNGCSALFLIGLILTNSNEGTNAPVKLEYKLKRGIELTYKTVGTCKFNAPGASKNDEAMLYGTERQIVVRVDNETGVSLMGVLDDSSLSMAFELPHGKGAGLASESLTRICLIDRTGDSVRKPLDTNAPSFGGIVTASEWGRIKGALAFAHYEKAVPEVAPLPSDSIKSGATWEGVEVWIRVPRPASVYTFEVPCKASCILTDLREVDGRRWAMIKCSLSAALTNEDAAEPVAVRGEATVLFDIERGLVIQRTVNAEITVNRSATSGKQDNDISQVIYTTRLESVGTLAPEELAKHAAAIEALNEAIEEACASDYDNAISALDNASKQDLTRRWKKAVTEAKLTAEYLRDFSQGKGKRMSDALKDLEGK